MKTNEPSLSVMDSASDKNNSPPDERRRVSSTSSSTSSSLLLFKNVSRQENVVDDWMLFSSCWKFGRDLFVVFLGDFSGSKIKQHKKQTV